MMSTENSSKLVAKATKNEENEWMDTAWSDGSQTSYPYVWLRDNCQCPKCFFSKSNARLLLMSELDPDIKPDKLEIDDKGNLTVIWPDGHQSSYTSNWLLDRSFTEEARENRLKALGLQYEHWGAEMLDNIPTFDYNKICSNDEYLLDWLTKIDRYGFTLVQNAPTEPDEGLKKLAERINFIKITNHGEIFTLKSRPNPTNVAYTTKALDWHSDLCYYDYVPGNSTCAGRNQFVDGANAAKIMQNNYPEYYKLLCEKTIGYQDFGSATYGEYRFLNYWPMFVRDWQGKVTQVRYSDFTRDSFLNTVPLEDVQNYYKALKKLHEILSDPKNCIRFLLKPGEMAVFDNLRVLHGRETYTVNAGAVRILQGMYIDWDGVRSRLRVLKETFRR